MPHRPYCPMKRGLSLGRRRERHTFARVVPVDELALVSTGAITPYQRGYPMPAWRPHANRRPHECAETS